MNCMVFSDIPNNRILQWSAKTGATVFHAPSHFANGLDTQPPGRLIACEHGAHSITHTEYDSAHHGDCRQLPGQTAQLS